MSATLRMTVEATTHRQTDGRLRMKTKDTGNILHDGELEAQRRFCRERTAENDAQANKK